MTLQKPEGEIWFERWMWSYMPCHWKGWCLLAVMVFVVILANVAIIPLAILEPSQDIAFIISMGLAVIALSRIARKHSR